MIKGLMLVEKYENDIIFRISCDCSSPSCDWTLLFTVDRKFPYYISLEMCSPYDFSTRSFFERVKDCWNILIHRRANIQSYIVLSEDQIKAFREALNISEEYLKGEQNA